jgi:hypothetical protein
VQEVEEQPLEWFDINDYGRLWNSNWRLAEASRGGIGATYLEWETNALVTFPRDAQPCRLESEIQVPTGNPELFLSVGSGAGGPWTLQTLVNDDSVLTTVVSSDSTAKDVRYRDLHVDLAKYAGQAVTVRLYQWLVDGELPGSAFWKTVEVRPQ